MKSYKVTVNGTVYDVTVEQSDGTTVSTPAAQSAPTETVGQSVSGSGTQVKSPMPGNILDIKVNVGDSVKAGQPLLILEAMKMENDIPSPIDGVVEAVMVNKGDTVEVDSVLATIK